MPRIASEVEFVLVACPEAAEAIDARLVEVSREALRHRLALEQGVLEPVALVG